MSFKVTSEHTANDKEQSVFCYKRDQTYNQVREEILRSLLRKIADEYDSAKYVGLFELFSDLSKIEERVVEVPNPINLNNGVRLDIAKDYILAKSKELINELCSMDKPEETATDSK